MSATALVWLATVIALAIVLALAGVQVAGALREARRLKGRIEGYSDLPVLAPVRNGGRNLHRLEAALARGEPLMMRANRALAEIRRGPIPPDSVAALRRVRRALAALGGFSKR